MSISNLYVLADVSLTAALRQPYPLFRTEKELEATAWLRANSGESETVLAAYETGNYLAAQAGTTVVLGHWAETFDMENKMELATAFYQASTDDEWRRNILEQYGVDFVWYGPQERYLGDFSPDESLYLEPVYTNGETTIYSVHP